MQIGISSYSFPWAVGVPGYPVPRPMSAFDLLDRATALGVSVVQFGDNLPLHTLTADEWQTLRSITEQRGLALEVGTRRLDRACLDRYVRLAAEARSPFVRFVIDDAEYRPSETDVIGIIQSALPVLEQSNVVLALENHDRFTAARLRYIIQQTDPRYVGICLDTTNSFGAGEDAHTVAATLAPYVVNLHAKDFTARRVGHKMGFTIEGCAPGEGLLKLGELLKTLRPHGRCRTVTLEQWPPFRDTITDTIATEARWAEQGVKWLKTSV